MAYYFRAFCTSPTVPKLSEVLGWVKERGVTLTVDPAEVPAGMDSGAWGDPPVSVTYAEGKQPFITEVNRNTGEDSLAAQETKEFLELVEGMKKSRKRDRVVEQLRDTKFVVACQIPTADFDDAGFHALDVFLAYFMVHSNGMIQADGQGFYEMGKLIMELE